MRLHIDTDMGVDDGLALVAATRLPDVTIAAVSTVFGNVALPVATRNALLFRALMGADWPVFEGAAGPRIGRTLDATHVHGDDGLSGATAGFGAVPLGAARRLDELQPGPGAPVVVLGIGPATNIVHLIERYGPAAIGHVVLMAGAVFDRGNITPEAEFNAACDPEALEAALRSGLPTTLVPLDLCRKVQLSRRAVLGYDTTTPAMRLIVESHQPYIDRYTGWEAIDACLPHDAIALLVASHPERFFTVRGRVTVEDSGRTRFVPAEAGPHRVAMGGPLAWLRRFLDTLDPAALA